jgi:hypothetical protein
MRKPHQAGEEHVLLCFRQCAAAAFRERSHAAIPYWCWVLEWRQGYARMVNWGLTAGLNR